MTTWRTKEALNETRFRVQNEWTSEAPGSFTGADATTAFLCGRGDADCMNPMELTRAEYELVRSHPTHFLIEKAPVSIGGAKPVVRAEAFDEHGSVIIVDGDLDVATAPQLGAVIAGQIALGHRHFVVDLSTATFLDCNSIGTLLHAIEPLRGDARAAVVLAGVHGIVERVLTVTRIGAGFAAFETTEAAIRGVSRLEEVTEPEVPAAWPHPHPSQ
jgi:anti-anti-sigma factor